MNTVADLTFMGFVAQEADAYVHTEVLYYPIGAAGGMQMPQLTIGAWLESEWRLSAATLDPQASAVVRAARAEVTRVRNRARELYNAKVRREFKSRIDSWSWFLDELSSGSSGYPSQVHLRLKLELLKSDVSQLDSELRRLAGCDGTLRSVFASGAFLWEPELAAKAPPESMWWLYGTPR